MNREIFLSVMKHRATDENGNALGKKAFCICTKSDIAKPGALEHLKEICKYPFDFVPIAAEEFEGLEELSKKMFELLEYNPYLRQAAGQTR